MRLDGVTVEQFDNDHERRSVYIVEDPALERAIHARLKRLLAPATHRAFQFEVTRAERLLVACYDSAEGGGHFPRAPRSGPSD
jgi:hypothetical protein